MAISAVHGANSPNLQHYTAKSAQKLEVSRFLCLLVKTKTQIWLNLGHKTHNWDTDEHVNAVIKCTQLLFSLVTSGSFTISFAITHWKGCIVLWPSLHFYLASGCTVEQRRKQTQLRVHSSQLARQDPAARKLQPLRIAVDRPSPRLNDIQTPGVPPTFPPHPKISPF